jgi:hypothetical protein
MPAHTKSTKLNPPMNVFHLIGLDKYLLLGPSRLSSAMFASGVI